jgi:hypothetical protein
VARTRLPADESLAPQAFTGSSTELTLFDAKSSRYLDLQRLL